MNALAVTLSITLAVIPSIMLRYAIFSKVVTGQQIQKLLHSYLICFIVQNILLYFIVLNTNSTISPLFYKVSNMILGILYFLINCLIIKGMLYKHIFVMGMQGCFSLVLHSLSSISLSFYSGEFSIQKQLIIHSFIYILLFLLIAFPLWSLLKDSLTLKYSDEHDYYWNVIWLIPALLFASNLMSTINDTWINSFRQLLARLFLGCALYIIWKCINLDFQELNEKYTLKSNNRLLQLQIDAINNQANTIMENDKKISILRHDLRHHVQMLSSLLDKGDLAATSSILNNLNDDLESTKPIIFCKNSIINASMLVYISRAHKEQIEIVSEIDIPEKIPWNSSDIAILFANVLENAIHASRKQPNGQKKIIIATRYADKKLAISVQNIFYGEILFDENGLPVTMDNNHGIGISSISSIVAKYHGHLTCSYEQNWFIIRCLFSELLIDRR